MPTIDNLKLVSMENAHEIIPKYIADNNIIIGSYEDMMESVLKMIKEKHFFNMDKNILRGFICCAMSSNIYALLRKFAQPSSASHKS